MQEVVAKSRGATDSRFIAGSRQDQEAKKSRKPRKAEV